MFSHGSGRILRRLASTPASLCATLLVLLGPAVDAAPAARTAPADTLRVQAQAFTPIVAAFARVEPMAAVPVQAIAPGIVTHLTALPGTTIRRGQVLAQLGGPEIEAALTRAKAAVKSAETRLAAGRKALSVQRQQLASHLTTEQDILQTESTVAAATGALATAQADLKSVELTATLRAAAAGTVLAVNVAEGQRVAAGDTLLTLEPASGLWLKAAVYGADVRAVRPGVTGTFKPSDGTPPIPVKVAALSPAISPDGGLNVWLRPQSASAAWRSGEFGRVTINGPTRSLPAVPTNALILDRDHWYVLVHTAQGDRPQEVVPGPARGWQTFIERGLAPGTEVVVTNAYLKYFRGIAEHYQPPD